MTNSPFRIALVGAGLITQGSHLPAALASPLISIAAIVEPVRERAAAIASAYGIEPVLAGRVEDVIDRIDGAVIATPNATHKELAVTCLSAGIPVLIEKPLAGTVQEGYEILQAAQRANKVVATGYSTRYRESTLLLSDLLRAKYFGQVRRFVHQFGTPGGWAPLSAYNLRRDTAGGGVLVVTGTHFLDRMLHFWGVPDEAWLEDDSCGGPEANCRAHFRYYDGEPKEGLAVYSKTARLPGGLVIDTERGIVVLRDTDDAEIILLPRDAPDTEQVVRRRGGHPYPVGVSEFQLQLEDFVHACRSGQSPRVDGEQGLQSLKLIERLYANRKPLGIMERQAA